MLITGIFLINIFII